MINLGVRRAVRHRRYDVRHYSAQEDWLLRFEQMDSKQGTAQDVALVKEAVEQGVLRADGKWRMRDMLVNSPIGTKSAMRLRDSVTALSRKDKDSPLVSHYKDFNSQLKNYLSIAFSSDTLQFGRVEFGESSGTLLEKVAEQDSVLHRVRTLRDLKKRLGEGRRCFALTHPSLPNDPIAFIHCALTPELAPSLPYLDETCREGLVPSHAMFYSVNAPHSALSGLDLATRIIKRAVQAVQEEFPTLTTFSTLSPVPSFMPWLQGAQRAPFPASIEDKLRVTAVENGRAGWEVGSDGGGAALAFLRDTLSSQRWYDDVPLREALREPLTWLGTYYLAQEKLGCGTDGLPFDPVARFHLRNGASMHRINAHGNPTAGGLEKSAGLMCNYLYSLPDLRDRHEMFVNSEPQGSFHMSSGVADTLVWK